MGAMRGLLEQFAKNALFIFTTNHIGRVPEPILSRVNHISFEFTPDEQTDLIRASFLRIKAILDLEGIEYDQKLVAQVVKSTFPDFRKTITTIQKGCINGVLKPIVLQGGNATYSELLDLLSDKNWKGMRDWVAENVNGFDFKEFYNEFSRVHSGKPVLADVVILTAKYDYQTSFASSREITIAAYLTEVMMVA
jgi:hypothetical protein